MGTLVPLSFQPGITREVSRLTNEGSWWDCDKVRFRMGKPETIGGWVPYTTQSCTGTPRSLHVWTALDNELRIGVGTSEKYCILLGGTYYDITPIRTTESLSNPFTATDGDATLTVTDNGHGAAVGSYVTFSGATGLGGNVTAAVLNQEHQVTEVVDGDTYTVELSVTPNSTDAATVVGAMQVSAL